MLVSLSALNVVDFLMHAGDFLVGRGHFLSFKYRNDIKRIGIPACTYKNQNKKQYKIKTREAYARLVQNKHLSLGRRDTRNAFFRDSVFRRRARIGSK